MERDGEKLSTEEQGSKVCDRKTKPGNWAAQQRKGGRHTNKVPKLLPY